MDTAIYFSNESIHLVTGKSAHNRIEISQHSSVSLPEGLLINGVITDEESLQVILHQLKQENKMVGNVHIVIDSSNILTKRCEVPFLTPKQLLNFTKEELKGSGENYDELIFDYSVLEKLKSPAKSQIILCCASERKILERYIQLFQSIDVKLKSIDIVLNSMIKMIKKIPDLAQKSFIFSVIEKEFMMSALFIDGAYVFANRSRLFAERGSESFSTEIVDKISSMIQFNKSEQHTQKLEAAYFYGLTDSELALCTERSQYLHTKISKMPSCPAVIFPTNSEGYDAADYFFAIGCLIRK